MAKRERFIVRVACPRCERHGVAIWEESEDPVYQRGEWSTVLTRTSEGFQPGPKGQIICAGCAVAAVVGSNREGPDN